MPTSISPRRPSSYPSRFEEPPWVLFATRLLEIGWTQGRDIADPKLLRWSLYGAIVTAARRYGSTEYEVLKTIAAIRKKHKFIIHPVLRCPDGEVSNRIQGFGCKATRLQCMEFLADIGRELAEV